MLRRALLVSLVVAAAWTLSGPAPAADDDLPVVVLDARKPADQRLLDWLTETIAATPAHVFIVQVDSPAVASGDPSELFSAITSPSRTVPVVVWVGPRPAVAGGGMTCLLAMADRGVAAPGTQIGMLEPTVIRGPDAPCPAPASEQLAAMAGDAVTVTEPAPPVVDDVAPSIGQVIVGLDGTVLRLPGGGSVQVDTATTRDDGSIVPARSVEFRKPGLLDRFLRLSARPEAAWFFLVAGIAMATFEFYAAGVGVTAAVAALSLFLAGYGLAILPVDLVAVAATAAGLLLYTWDFQRVSLGWRSIAGTALLVYGGLAFTDGAGQLAPVWWIVIAVVVGTALFYGVALTTIARSRFSTRTIGRGHLVGRAGTAATDLTPDGVVEVDGARWRGRSHREAGIRAGDPVSVTDIAGIVLEVEPDRRSDVRD